MNKSAVAYGTLPGLKQLMSVEHQLKVWPEHFEALTHPDRHRRKTVEIRRDDRGYCVGDTLHLREWDPKTETYSGWSARFLVTHLLRGGPYLPDGYVAMSIMDARLQENCHMKLRPEVEWFAEKMEHVLQQNEYKGGWRECGTLWLMGRLREEVEELAASKGDQIIKEAADVANFAMMIADVARGGAIG